MGRSVFIKSYKSPHINASERIELVADTKVELYGMHEARSSSVKESLVDVHPSNVQSPCISTHADELGRIVFSAVPPGCYLIIVYLPETEIVIEELNICLH